MNKYKIYEDTVKEMLRDGESGLYIKIYINDLLRGKDITTEESQQLHFIMIDAIGGNGFATLTERRD